MNTFSAKYRLTSCLVDRELIAEIEKYIFEETKSFFADSDIESGAFEAGKGEMYHIFIQTKSGSIRLASIDEFDEEMFPDNIQSIAVDFSSYKNIFMNIRVLFHSSFSEHPSVEIFIKGEHAKENAVRLGSGIKSLVSAKRTTNHWYHNRTLLLGMLFVYTVWNVINYFVLTVTPSATPMHITNNLLFNFLFAMLTVWIIVSIFVRPYVTFRTGRQTIISLGYNVFSVLYFIILIVLFYNNFRK